MAGPDVDLSLFLGEWQDSLGHIVKTSGDSRGLRVSLSKPGSDKEIVLTIKKLGPGKIECGHYSLDEASAYRIVWRDKRWRDRMTVWSRPGQFPQQPFTAAGGLQDASIASQWQAPTQASASIAKSPWNTPGQAALPVPSKGLIAAVQTAAAQATGSRAVPPWQKAREAQAASTQQSTATVSASSTSATGQAVDENDWSHVLNVLASAKEDGTGQTWGQGGEGDDSDDDATEPEDEDGDQPKDEAQRWTEVLDLLSAHANTQPEQVAPAAPAAPQVDELFAGFGYNSTQQQEAPATDEVRQKVLEETLQRLMREKTGAQASQGSAPQAPQVMEDPYGGVADPTARSQEQWQPRENPLDRFIKVFRLDALAAKCLRALSDDEAAFVIESCQGRLKKAKNPSALVMTSIKNVASKVGRRYYGNREAADLRALLGGVDTSGINDGPKQDLKMIIGEPEIEEEAVEEPNGKRQKTSAVEVLEGEPEDDDDGCLFFEDTTGGYG